MSAKTRVHAGLAAAILTITTGLFPGTTPAHAAEADPLVGWQHETAKVLEAQKVTRGKGVVVGIHDSGVSEHPYFKDKSVIGGYGYADLLGPRESGSAVGLKPGQVRDPSRTDLNGHGTAMAGVTLSVAPEASIMPLRFGDFDVLPDAGTAAKLIIWGVNHGAKVISMSWGGVDSPDLRWALQYAAHRDVVLVAAAGNDNHAQTYGDAPAIIPGVLNVAATDRSNAPSKFSNFGPQILIAAPGEGYTALKNKLKWDPNDITRPNSDTTTVLEDKQGTSPAAAFVAGVAALVRAKFPNLNAASVVQRMTATATDLGTQGRDDRFGHGLINAHAALTANVDSVKESTIGYPLGKPGAPDKLLNAASKDTGRDAAGSSDSSNLFGWVFGGVAVAALIAAMIFLRGRKPAPGGGHGRPHGGGRPPGPRQDWSQPQTSPDAPQSGWPQGPPPPNGR